MNKIWNRQYIILFSLNVILNISFYMVSTALSKHLVELGMTVTIAGTIVGAMPMASMLIRPVSGWICDHFSKKRLLAIFLLLNCICVLGYGLVHSETIYLLLRIMHGISFGITTTITMTLITSYIPEGRLGEGLGYFGLAQTIAMAVGPSVGLALSWIAGNRFMFFFASLCVFISLLSAFFLEEGIRLETGMGVRKLQLKLGDFFAKEALLFGTITLTLSSLNGIESSYITLYGEQFGITNVGWYFTLSAVILLFSRTLCGKMVDKRGLSAVLYPGAAMIGTAFLLLSGVNYNNKFILFSIAAVLKAIGVGAVQPALQASAIQSVKSERRGAATSTFYVGTDLGQATAPVIAGRIIDTNGYPFMFRIYLVPLVMVSILYGIIELLRKRKRFC